MAGPLALAGESGDHLGQRRAERRGEVLDMVVVRWWWS